MSKSAITISPIHAGEILREEFLIPLGISASALAVRLSVPTNRITRVLNGQASVTAETATLLSAALGTTPQFWLNLQLQFDLETVAQDADLHHKILQIKPLISANA